MRFQVGLEDFFANSYHLFAVGRGATGGTHAWDVPLGGGGGGSAVVIVDAAHPHKKSDELGRRIHCFAPIAPLKQGEEDVYEATDGGGRDVIQVPRFGEDALQPDHDRAQLLVWWRLRRAD